MPSLVDQRRTALHTQHTGVLILAGGKGSRLSPLTDSRCKPAVPFGGKYRIIDFTLSNCMNSGFRAIGVLTQYLPLDLIEHCHMAWGWTHRVFGDIVLMLPSHTGPQGQSWYSGTADAVYQQYLGRLVHGNYKHVLVLSGDHIYKMDYSEMLEAHIDSGADISIGIISVPSKDASRFGIVKINNEGRITDFYEKPENPPLDEGSPDKALASMGIYIFERDVLKSLLDQDQGDTASSHDFGKDIIPKACQTLNVHGFRFESSGSGVQRYWRDVGTLDSYFDANMDLISVSPELDIYDEFWPIWSYMISAPGAKFVFKDDSNGRGMAYNSIISAGCVITSQVEDSLLFNHCRVEKHASVESSVLLPHVTIGESCVIRNALIDENCTIPDHTQIGVDLEQDRQRFYVTEQGRVIVTPAMLKK